MIPLDCTTLVINGSRHTPDTLPDIVLDVARAPSAPRRTELCQLRLTNRGGVPLKPTAVELNIGLAAAFGRESGAFRFYKEGLTAVGVAGARGASDCDFELDPNFLKLTVSDPVDYAWRTPGRFRSEQVGVFQAPPGGEALLAGFVTANVCFSRIQVERDASGGVTMQAVVETEGLVLPPGESVVLETLMLAMGRDVDALLAAYADALGASMGARLPTRMPSGWCSYYFYYGQETEADILENARYLAKHRDTLPVEVIQIDEGWQQARGNWLERSPAKFPHGMAWLAARIRELGFRPGIWVAPFLVAEQAPLHRDHPDWLLRDRQGHLLTMGDNPFIDPTHPEALAWLAEVFGTLRNWGYGYFKLDFLFAATCHGACYRDGSLTRVQAYRGALRVIREAVGPDAFLLGGTSLIAANVGLVDGCRISTDVTPFWCRNDHTPESPAIFNVCRNIINRGYMHKRLWINDPDCLIVREHHNRPKYAHVPSLTLAETQMLASAMILSGGSLFLGDRLASLSPERVAIIRQVLALSTGTAAFPVDRMAGANPRIWFRRGDGSRRDPHLLGVFNWDDDFAAVQLPLADLGIPLAACTCGDVWLGGEAADVASLQPLQLGPHTCRLLQFVTRIST